MTRQSYRLTAGNLGNLKIETDTLPDPAENEVSVQVKAIGLNFADIFAIWGLYSATPKGCLRRDWNTPASCAKQEKQLPVSGKATG